MTSKIRHTIIPEVYLVLTRQEDILLIRRFNTGFEDGNYTLIAGHVEAGESFSEALIREAREEANITIMPHHLKAVHIMHRKYEHEERIGVFMHATNWENEPCIMEPHKHDDLRWISLKQLPVNISPYVKLALANIQNHEFYSELS
jgi:ADP-ribose pyrophosphatase YjhB (NUDIX family)